MHLKQSQRNNAASFQGANLSANVFAQNWLDLDAERGPSSFDQRHQVTASFHRPASAPRRRARGQVARHDVQNWAIARAS
jgi:hypothetical protein